jgi:hypothetical protein
MSKHDSLTLLYNKQNISGYHSKHVAGSHVLLQAPMFTLPVNVLLAVTSTPPQQ